MELSWQTAERQLTRLLDRTNEEGAQRARASKYQFEPPAEVIDRRIIEAAADVPTPAIIWDTAKLKQNVTWIRDLLTAHGFGLNVGLKACANREILALLRDLGLDADAQSMGEYQLAKDVDFNVISATGPIFRPRDMQALVADGVLFDAQSYTQLEQLVGLGLTEDIGVRFQVPRPLALRSSTQQSETSRFGIPFDEDAYAWFSKAADVDVSRIRVHTSEGLSADAGLALEFRTRLALLQASAFGTVREVNLGGGMLALARNPRRFEESMAAMADAVEEYKSQQGFPELDLWLEPGAALVLDSAYLIAEVVDADPVGNSVVLDVSPWNVAPWAHSSFHVLEDEPWEFVGDVYGPTLYEKDKFRSTKEAAGVTRVPRIGQRLLINCFGAYTLTQARKFGRFPLPREFQLVDGALLPFPEAVSA